MNRRHFFATVGAAALARNPAAAGATPMMSDLIGHFYYLHPPGSDPRKFRRNFDKMCRLWFQTGPLVLKGAVVSARREGNEYVLTQSVEPFLVDRSSLHGGRRWEVLEMPDEELSLVTGIPLASRTPVPAWAFRTP
jgi:hypothetical protein